jgi:methylthioribulose-1-phosphate dehydratase
VIATRDGGAAVIAAGDATMRALAEELAAAARRLAGRGLCEATSGNFSARLPTGALVSKSGVDKGTLGPDDFVVVDASGAALPESTGRASAEAPLHLAVYVARPAGAVVHTHGVAAASLSRARVSAGALVLSGWEMLKALEGVTTHEHVEALPVFDNTQDMRALSKDVGARLAAEPGAHGFLVAGHGLTTWGTTVADAVRHAEAFEQLFACEIARASIR